MYSLKIFSVIKKLYVISKCLMIDLSKASDYAMPDSENTEAESLKQESKETGQEEATKESDKGEPDKKKAAGGGKVEAGDAPIMKTRNYNVSAAFRSVTNLDEYYYHFRLIEKNG